MKKRIYMLDFLRGTAVILMVIYHTIYTFANILNFDFFFRCFKFLQPFSPPVIATMFILISAYSCSLSKNNLKRGVTILGVAIAISLVTIFALPLIGIDGEGIYFGILHFLGVALIVSPIIFKICDKVPFYIGIPLFIISAIGTNHIKTTGFFGVSVTDPFSDTINLLFPFGIYHGNFYSADYYPLLPWIFVFAVGCYLPKLFPHDKLPQQFFADRFSSVKFIGRHALVIYIVHQPIIYAIGIILSSVIAKVRG